MTTPESKLEWINERIAEGRTVYVTTQTKSTKITPKTVATWAKAGNDLIKVDGTGSLVMASGRNFVSIDYCKITAK